MKGPPPPLRFLALVVGGWVAIRAAMLAPEWLTTAADAEVRPPALIAIRTIATGPVVQPLRAAAAVRPPMQAAAGQARAVQSHLTAIAPIVATEPTIPVGHSLASAAEPTSRAGDPQAAAIPAIALLPLPGSTASRWSGSAWLFARSGERPGLAAGGSLGGSQAGARLLFRLDPRLALSARLYTPLESTRGAEAALGLEWQPSRSIPLRLLAERRQRLGRDGRSAFALLAYGGVSERPIAGPVRLDAYAQAGLVGLSRRDAFADGALRLSLPVEKDLSAGAALWGAAQPGVSRLDIGPSLSLRHRVGSTNLRLSADWRFRIAGEAAPGSGPALTIASDF